MLEIHEAKIGLDRDRGAADRAGKALDAGPKEARIVKQSVDAGKLRGQKLHLLGQKLLPQGGLTVAQPQHPEPPKP